MKAILLSKAQNGRTSVYSTLDGVTWMRHKSAAVKDAEAEREAGLWTLAYPSLDVRRHDAGADGRPFPDDITQTTGFRVC